MKLKNWLMAIGMAVVVLSFASCSKESANNKKIVGEWTEAQEKYFLDGKEILLEEGQCLYIYKGNDEDYYDMYKKTSFSFLAMTFYSDGNMEFCGFPGTYKLNGNQIICSMYGDETLLSIEDEYIVDSEEVENITGYLIKGEIEEWPYEGVIEDKRNGAERVFKVSKYYSKVN